MSLKDPDGLVPGLIEPCSGARIGEHGTSSAPHGLPGEAGLLAALELDGLRAFILGKNADLGETILFVLELSPVTSILEATSSGWCILDTNAWYAGFNWCVCAGGGTTKLLQTAGRTCVKAEWFGDFSPVAGAKCWNLAGKSGSLGHGVGPSLF